MNHNSLIVMFFVLLIVLTCALAISATWLITAHNRASKTKQRLKEALSLKAQILNEADVELQLVRTESSLDKLKNRMAAQIGVDLKQSETYPIKWWLVPPLALLATLVIIWMASHPLGTHAFLWMIVKYIGTPVLWYVLIRYAFNWMKNRRDAQLTEQFPDALNMIVRSVRVGIPIAEALRSVASEAREPTKREFSIMADKVSIGIPLEAALEDLSKRVKLTEYQFFATAIALQTRSGGGIVHTLETLAEVIRKRLALKSRGYALTAEARMSSMILLILPFFAGGALFVIKPSYIEVLFKTSSGQSVLGAAALLMMAGVFTIQFMINNVLK